MRISGTALASARMGASEIDTIRIGSLPVWERTPGPLTLPLPPPPAELTAPAGAPVAPGGAYTTSFTGTAAALSPVVASWHDALFQDETFTLAGARFTTLSGNAAGSDTIVWVGAKTATGFDVLEAEIISVEESLLAAVMPAGIPYGAHFLWVENANGPGNPVAVNRARARFIGPLGNTAQAGAVKRVIGKSLSRNGGVVDSYVYLKNGGTWTSLTVGVVTPYSVEFTVPAGLANGTYQIYTHNGHGGQYGWSGPLDLVVASPFVRGSTEVSVSPSGGDDTTAIRNAITNVSGQANGGTVRLSSGNYLITDLVFIGSNVRLIGAGKDLTNITIEFSASADNGARAGIIFNGSRIELNGFTATLALGALMPLYSIMDTGYPTPAYDCRIVDVRWTSENDVYDYANDQQWRLERSEIVDCHNCRELKVKGPDNWIHDTLSWGSSRRTGENGAEAAFEIACERLIFENNHVETPDWAEAMQPYEFLARRVFHSGGQIIWCLFMNNTSTNTTGLPGENKGESLLFHHSQGVWYGQAVSHAGLVTTVRTDGLIDGVAFTNIGKTGSTAYTGTVPSCVGMHLLIAGGRGISQIRQITAYTSNTITVASAWRIDPDSTSKLVVLFAYLENIFYNNTLHAFPTDIDPYYSASSGFGFDGNSFYNVVDGLTCTHTFWSSTIFGATLGPCYFNDVRGVDTFTVLNAGHAFLYYMRSTTGTLDMLGRISIGNAVRSCEVEISGPQDSNDPEAVRHFGEVTNLPSDTMHPYSFGNIVENCVSYGGRKGIAAGIKSHTVYRKNNVSVDNTVPQTGSIFNARAVEVASNSLSDFQGNTYTSPFAVYSGSTAARLGIPVRSARLTAAAGGAGSKTVPVWNMGTASGTWIATTNTAWISLTPTNTTLAAEATTGSLLITASAAALSAGTHSGSVDVTMAGATKTISVKFQVT